MEKQKVYRIMKQEARITDYAGRLGFTLVRKGRYYSLKEHDSVMIDPVKNCFWRNSRPGNGNAIGKGGSVIDFVCEFTDLPLHEVLKMLSEDVFSLGKLPEFERKADMEKPGNPHDGLLLPKADGNMHNVFAYLVRTRKIRAEVVQMMVDRKQLYQDVHKNCVFISYDLEDGGKPVFGCRRGTNTFRPFYGDLAGNDYSQCFYVDQKAPRIYITESVIDAMSVMTLKDHPDRYNYLALAGVGKADCIDAYLGKQDIHEIWIGTDQDEGGREAARILEGKIREKRPDIRVVEDLPEKPYKDWNDVLRKRS